MMDLQADSKRPVFGNRHLTDEAKVFQHNAWDNVQWTEEQEEEAKAITQNQAAKALSVDDQNTFLKEASSYWNKFYEKHDNKFFKDRHWLFTEFPELMNHQSSSVSSAENIHAENEDANNSKEKNNKDGATENFAYPGCNAKLRYMEVGCGAGNTIFPVLNVNCNEDLFMYGCDYSQAAVDIVTTHRDYNPKRCHVFMQDISSNDKAFPFPAESLDIVVMIFVLSALEFGKMSDAVKRIAKLLKPGGLILFRDYGRYDMAQLRFKQGRCLSENFYTRGDGTLVYFFTQEEVRDIFTGAGLVEEQNLVDRRLQVNRARQLKMYRVWVQAKYRRPVGV